MARRWKISSNGKKRSTDIVFEVESNPTKRDGSEGKPFAVSKFMLNDKKMVVVKIYQSSYTPDSGKRKGKLCHAGFFQIVEMTNNNNGGGSGIL